MPFITISQNIHNEEIAGLSWKDLSEEEKALSPPILIVGNQNAQSERLR